MSKLKHTYSTIIIGLGDIGLNYDLKLDKNKYVYTHSRAVHLHSAFELKAGIDISKDVCSKFSELYGIDSFESIKEALIKIRPEVIIVSTSSSAHLSVIQEISKYSTPLAILCEKPMGNNLKSGKEILRICEKIGSRLYVNYVRSCMPGNIEIKSRIKNQSIKTPAKCVVWYTKGLEHNGAHFINLMEDWFGSCLEQKVITKSIVNDGVNFNPTVLLKFEQCEVILIAGWEKYFSHYTIELISKSGRLFWDKDTLAWNEITKDNLIGDFKKLSLEHEEIFIGVNKYQSYVLDQLCFALDGKESSICDGQRALETLNIIDKIKRSNNLE
jgi:predicted dehydrogenase